MFCGFNLTGFSLTETLCDRDHNKSRFNKEGSDLYDSLVDLFSRDSAINAEEVANVIFPTKNCDVFLSHSSMDIDLALKIKARLQSIGLDVFIDSLVWRSVYELLKAIDKKYCLNSNGSYDYKKCQASASHIYMILNSALHHMIDKSEAFMFVNTDKSLVKDSTYSVINDEKTYSAWIHSELNFSKLVERKLRRTKLTMESRQIILDSAMAFKVKHSAPLGHLIPLNESNFDRWIGSAKNKPYPLDLLYHHCQPS